RGAPADAPASRPPRLHPPGDGHATPPAPYSATLPAEVSRRAQREMDRLRRLPTGAPEAAQVRAYLQWLWSTPWETLAGEDADLRHVQAELEQEHLGLGKAKERILEYLAVRRVEGRPPPPAPLRVGSPRAGRTA